MTNVLYLRLRRHGLEAELHRWGRWLEARADYEGYASVNVLFALIAGRGGAAPGHRILCLDMPTDVYSVHRRVLMLSEALQDAVRIRYVTQVKPNGTLWTDAERCKRIGISEETLRVRLSRARQKLLGLPYTDKNCNVVTLQVDLAQS